MFVVPHKSPGPIRLPPAQPEAESRRSRRRTRGAEELQREDVRGLQAVAGGQDGLWGGAEATKVAGQQKASDAQVMDWADFCHK